MPRGAASFAESVLRRLHDESELAKTWLQARPRGATATIGLEEDGEWVPLLRFANGAGAFNVMDLQVRDKSRWAPTGIRGVPNLIADQLVGPLRFTWEFQAQAADAWQRTSDHEH